MTVEELNNHIATGEIDELMRVAEARQVKELSKIADTICARPNVRLVLLAGGSSAGKTTTAKRLCTQLRVNGRAAILLSTDDYFVEGSRYPRDENGNLDYEHVECVDIARLSHDVNALLRGEAIVERRFDFAAHDGYDTERRFTLPEGGIVAIEGIHALNPRLTDGVDEALKFRVLIEPKPSLQPIPGMAIASSDARFLRRIVRDRHFRKTEPADTVRQWPNVLAGEQKWIVPFMGLADARFDSYLVYELAVLKPYAGGLLAKLVRANVSSPLVTRATELFSTVTAIDATRVPGDSILRETIGGSQLDY